MSTNNTVYFLALGMAAFTVIAAEKKDPPTYLTPEEAGPDFLNQGEYINEWGGAQVIALGNNQFRLVIYKCGLPGTGWDGSEKNEMDGQREGDIIKFKTNRPGWSHTLGKDVLTTQTDQGTTYTMRKTTRQSPTLGAKPPPGAVVLFDGVNTDAWEGGHMDNRNLLAAGTKSKQSFKDCTLHLEFLLPFKPLGRGQGRGNSGVYLQDRYEIQVLDSFGLNGENNECGGLYSKARPLVNMCFPPLTWQTYDADFVAAKFDASGKKIKNAVLTMKHNGVVIHDKLEVPDRTGGGKPEGPDGGPIQLQGHGNPVFYRNIWVLEK
jgi:hypothetical protein